MLINQTGYELLIWGWIALACFTFIMLMFIRAPYGRHLRPGWGPSLPARAGWIIMESPSIILMTIFFAFNGCIRNIEKQKRMYFLIKYLIKEFIYVIKQPFCPFFINIVC